MTPAQIMFDFFRAMEATGRLPTVNEIKDFAPYVSKDLINRVIKHIESTR